ncbi:MULE transposase domain-containing protein [Hirsutella rhossiliensis]|uniref:MULE transposase domain-containing protein n=1 Tax=Hirsutella rhossiliensis TaxID=111463 RepID=A0A9P8MSN5_9HYPO|nr:MULE transposase domain-containing protein [Hirsutella rhossiliensis]KAH0961253.1 MULE transposase domain-containing protein [Hirsutella rhossiliensis]
MWKRFPEVISFDNTYNTNRFKLPLFQATGQTCLKSVYNAAFGLIDNERREGFQFLAEGIRQLVERHGIQLPNVVITDFDQQMKAALEDQFQTLNNSFRKWKHAKEDSDETKEDYEKVWVRLCDEFDDQEAILIYLYNTYLPLSPQWSQCFIKKHRNFGIRVTSGTEASNNNVKSYLLNGMNHLFGLIEAIEGMLGDQERDFIDNCAQDEVLTTRTYSSPGSEYLGELRMTASQQGLIS